METMQACGSKGGNAMELLLVLFYMNQPQCSELRPFLQGVILLKTAGGEMRLSPFPIEVPGIYQSIIACK
jgi:hypothetical protein